MNLPELFGRLSDGNRYRVTNYAVQILDASGMVLGSVDMQHIVAVKRTGNTVRIETDDLPFSVTGASLDDAGRLEGAIASFGIPTIKIIRERKLLTSRRRATVQGCGPFLVVFIIVVLLTGIYINPVRLIVIFIPFFVAGLLLSNYLAKQQTK